MGNFSQGKVFDTSLDMQSVLESCVSQSIVVAPGSDEMTLTKFTCPCCGKVFAHKGSFRVHIRTHTGEKPFGCEQCGEVFKCSFRDSSFGFLVQYGDSQFTSRGGNKEERRSLVQMGQPLSEHLSLALPMSIFTCSICKKKFSYESLLKRHMHVHTGERPFGCHICDIPENLVVGPSIDNSFDESESFLIANGVDVSSIVEAAEDMDFCNLPNKSPVLPPIRQMLGKTCRYCGKDFLFESRLKRHLYVHTGERPFQCQHCGKTFNQKASLGQHLLTHSRVKPYECNICGKQFIKKNNLTIHSRIHTAITYPLDKNLVSFK